MNGNGDLIRNDKEIANEFCEFFSNKKSNSAEKVKQQSPGF